ncbi:NUDIX hydrolase [Rhizorhapis sp. SPR117]|uniref:NUDIX hydrolase n=1 Tax=Rhizorhapis sp. SPR117 TaxID=2912611 RepID=UPI001F2A85F1|nr:NUDIX hydrolase [Rhizorhapis sp. SPR117]
MTDAIETMWEGRFITAKRQGTWEYVSRSRGIEAAVILAIEEAMDGRHILLVEQYRVPLKAACLELPAGLIGDHQAGEDPAGAAARELEEETGYRAGTMTNLGRFYSSPGMVSESFTLFRAADLVKTGEGGGTDGENIIVHRVPMDGIADYIAARRTEGMAIDVKLLLLLADTFLR